MPKTLVAVVLSVGLLGACGSSSGRDPYQGMKKVPTFTVTSADLKDGGSLARAQYSGIFGAGGNDTSPQLSWKGFPADTKSFAVTMYDPDAATESGFWHWAVADIPASVTSLPSGAGALNSKTLPPGAFQMPNDGRTAQYVGAAPPKGSGTHHYYITVYALDVPTLQVDPNLTPAFLVFTMGSHTLARAHIVGLAKT